MAAVIDRAEFRELGILVAVEEYFDDGTGLRTNYAADGAVTGTQALTGLPVPVVVDDPAAAVLAAVQTARTAATTAATTVDSLSANGATRRSVEALISSNEALANAVEALVTPPT